MEKESAPIDNKEVLSSHKSIQSRLHKSPEYFYDSYKFNLNNSNYPENHKNYIQNDLNFTENNQYYSRKKHSNSPKKHQNMTKIFPNLSHFWPQSLALLCVLTLFPALGSGYNFAPEAAVVVESSNPDEYFGFSVGLKERNKYGDAWWVKKINSADKL